MIGAPKYKPYRNKKILDAAKGERCTWPGCGVQDGTVVFAHSNLIEDGKGVGKKADDCFGAFLCVRHHDSYDGRGAFGRTWSEVHQREHDAAFHRAMKRTWKRLLEKGVLK